MSQSANQSINQYDTLRTYQDAISQSVSKSPNQPVHTFGTYVPGWNKSVKKSVNQPVRHTDDVPR